MKYYIVTYERKPLPVYKEFHTAFVKGEGFKTWWHYIQSCYLIGTDRTANEISQHFTQCAKDAGVSTTHLVLKVDLSERQGLLVKDAWAWMKKQS